MKKKILIPILVLGLLVSLCAAAYPGFYAWYSERHHSEIQTEYEVSLDATDGTIISDAFADAEEYNEKLASGEYNVLDYAKNGYFDLLDLTGNGIIGFLEIPKIDLALTIYHGTSDSVLRKGVGHMEQTSLPTGTAGTHAVLSAHTGTTNQRLFTDLVLLKLGDIFYVTVLGKEMAYQVDQIVTVQPDDIDDIQIIAGEDLITLSTCTPYGINSHRLLVRGHRIELEKAAEVTESTENTQIELTESIWAQHYIGGILGGLICAVIVIVLFLLLILIRRRKHKKTE